MVPLRITLLGFTLGLATWMGWLCTPGSSAADNTGDGPGPVIAKTVVHPSQAPSPGRRLGRQRTEPDPTSDEWQPLAVDLDDQDNEGSAWVVQGTLSPAGTCSLLDSQSPAWSEPLGDNPLLLITHRFRF
jgi:hypothetical protein